MNRAAVLVLGLFAVASAWGDDPRFRADDGNFWRLEDNPALAAVSGDLLSVGFDQRIPPDGWPNWSSGPESLQLISPLLSFRYTWQGSDSTLGFGTSVGPVAGITLGYRSDMTVVSGMDTTTHNFGLLWRPLDLASAAVTVDDAFGPGRIWGAGLALRPLTLAGPRGNWWTLAGDVSWNGASMVWERVGTRFSWDGSDVRLWYNLQSRSPGVEVSLALGPSETTGSADHMGQAFRWSSKSPEMTAFGPVILRIRDLGPLDSAPRPKPVLSLGPSRADLPGLLALLNRAAKDPRVVAVAFEAPPAVGGLAMAQDLERGLDRLKKAGKKVYIHSDGYNDNLGFQGWTAGADRVSLSPTGEVWLVSGRSNRLYMKDFFDKIGVKFINLAPWDTKSVFNTLSDGSMPEGERAMMTRFLNDRDDQARQALALGRGSRLKAAAKVLVAGGPYLLASEALDRGLVDALESRSGFETFLTAAHPGAVVVDDIPPARDRAWGPPSSFRTVALVHLTGDIIPGPGRPGQSIGRAAAETLEALRKDPAIHGVVLRVDSPGGAVGPSDDIAEQVKETVAAGKPVVVVMGDLAASGGYYISAPASRIFARPGTVTGSIGVTAALFSGEKTLGLLGIKADGVALSPSSTFGDWTKDPPEADTKKWNAMILGTYDRFLDVVSAGRKIDKAKLEPLARGQIYTGREALALGLVDDLGGMEEARTWLEKTLGGTVEFKDFIPGETSPFDGILGSLADAVVKTSESPTLRLAGTLDQWAAPWAEAVTGVAARGGGALVWADLAGE